MRHLIRRLFPHLTAKPEDGDQGYAFDSGLLASLQAMAENEQRPLEAVAEDLLSLALQEKEAEAFYLMTWRKLSPRLQQVTALVCLGYTNGEIAQRLNISTETVKSHVRTIHERFATHSKAELRAVLERWDFSSWD